MPVDLDLVAVNAALSICRCLSCCAQACTQERLVRIYQVGSRAEKLRELFLRWGAFIEKKTSPDGGQPSNVVAVQFGGRV